MATGIEASGPITGQPWTGDILRMQIGQEAGIRFDTNGSAYGLTLPTGSDVAEVGSTSLRSVATVAGMAHWIPQGQTQSVPIPASSDASVGRTDIIALKYDPAWEGTAPGPVRLVRIAGTEGSAGRPGVDEGYPSVEHLPLWAVTRKSGQSLNQAGVVDLRRWIGDTLLGAATLNPLPTDVPLGTRIRRTDTEYVRQIVSGSPEWVGIKDPMAGVRPVYTRSRETASSVFGPATFVFAAATNAYGGGDWGTHIGITVGGPSLVEVNRADVYTLKTSGIYTLEAFCTIQGQNGVDMQEYAGDLYFVLQAGGTGSQRNILPRHRFLYSDHDPASGLITTTRWFAAGTQVRVQGSVGQKVKMLDYYMTVMKVSD